MSIDKEISSRARPSSLLRPDQIRVTTIEPQASGVFWNWPRRFAVLVALATGFVLLGGARLDLGLTESRLGLAAQESLGPLGQVFGGWDPSIWVGRLVPSLLWSWGEGFM